MKDLILGSHRAEKEKRHRIRKKEETEERKTTEESSKLALEGLFYACGNQRKKCRHEAMCSSFFVIV